MQTEVVSLGNQIQQFATVRGNITAILGPKTTGAVLSKSLFIISIGSNDLFEKGSEFMEPFSNTTMKHLQITYQNHLKVCAWSIIIFCTYFYFLSIWLVKKLHIYELQNLYKLGARKFGIISVPPIGCCPYARVQSNDPSVCVEELNELAQIFFIETQALLQKLSLNLKGMKYSLGNAYEMTMSIIEDPLAFGKYISSQCDN